MIEISRAHKFMGLDLQTAWSNLKTSLPSIVKDVISPAKAAASVPASVAPPPSGVSTTMIVVGVGAVVIAGAAIFFASKD
jgi:hypothetical protein